MSFTTVRNALFSAAELTAPTLLVLLVLADCERVGVCWPAMKLIVERTGLSRRRVCEAIAELRTAGILGAGRNGVAVSKTNPYTLTIQVPEGSHYCNGGKVSEVLRNTTWGLSSNEKLVLAALVAHENDMTGQCNPSQPLLARVTKLTLRTVGEHIQRLQGRALITATSLRIGGVLRNSYQISLPDFQAEAGPQLIAEKTPLEKSWAMVSNLLLSLGHLAKNAKGEWLCFGLPHNTIGEIQSKYESSPALRLAIFKEVGLLPQGA